MTERLGFIDGSFACPSLVPRLSANTLLLFEFAERLGTRLCMSFSERFASHIIMRSVCLVLLLVSRCTQSL